MKYNILKKKHFILPVLFILLAASVVAVINPKLSSSETVTTPCSGILITPVLSAGSPVTTLSGIVSINVVVPTASSQQNPTNVIISASDSTTTTPRPIGYAVPTSNGVWTYKWATLLWRNSTTTGANYNYSTSLKLFAQIVYPGVATACTATSSDAYTLYNPTQTTASKLSLSSTLQELNGTTGSTQSIQVKTSVTPTIPELSDLSKYSIYTWTTPSTTTAFNATNTDPSNNSIRRFSAGTEALSGSATVKVLYGGSESTITIPVKITKPEPVVMSNSPNATATTTSPDRTSTTTTTTTNNNAASSQTTAATDKAALISTTSTTEQISSSKITLTESAKTCIETVLGAERGKVIESGASKQTPEELIKTSSCFAQTNNIMPTAFSPIDPLSIDSVKTADTISVNSLKTVKTTSDDGTTKDALKITGKGKPNSVLILYIFSDPLVITVTTDDSGNWVYNLVDPLQPGKHEVYAVVNKGDGTYTRSDPTSFFIATAAASAGNPNGLSLSLSGTPTKTPTELSMTTMIIYIAGGTLIVIIALIILFLILRSHNKHKIALKLITQSKPDCAYCNPDKQSQPIAQATIATSVEPINDEYNTNHES